jgi:hypothetical protein
MPQHNVCNAGPGDLEEHEMIGKNWDWKTQ